MVLAVLPMVELVGVPEGVHDGLEDRLQNLGVAIYTKSIHKKFQEASSKITTHCRPPRKGVKQTSFCPPPLCANHLNTFIFLSLVFPTERRHQYLRGQDPGKSNCGG